MHTYTCVYHTHTRTHTRTRVDVLSCVCVCVRTYTGCRMQAKWPGSCRDVLRGRRWVSARRDGPGIKVIPRVEHLSICDVCFERTNSWTHSLVCPLHRQLLLGIAVVLSAMLADNGIPSRLPMYVCMYVYIIYAHQNNYIYNYISISFLSAHCTISPSCLSCAFVSVCCEGCVVLSKIKDEKALSVLFVMCATGQGWPRYLQNVLWPGNQVQQQCAPRLLVWFSLPWRWRSPGKCFVKKARERCLLIVLQSPLYVRLL
jgi:hypothetical protein